MLDVMDKTRNQKLLAPERGEPQRSGGEPNAGADNRPAAAPDPEVSARPQCSFVVGCQVGRTSEMGYWSVGFNLRSKESIFCEAAGR